MTPLYDVCFLNKLYQTWHVDAEPKVVDIRRVRVTQRGPDPLIDSRKFRGGQGRRRRLHRVELHTDQL